MARDFYREELPPGPNLPGIKIDDQGNILAGTDRMGIKFVINTEADDIKDSLDALKQAWEMNLPIPQATVYQLLGIAKPTPDEEVLQGPQPEQPGQPGMEGMPAEGGAGEMLSLFDQLKARYDQACELAHRFHEILPLVGRYEITVTRNSECRRHDLRLRAVEGPLFIQGRGLTLLGVVTDGAFSSPFNRQQIFQSAGMDVVRNTLRTLARETRKAETAALFMAELGYLPETYDVTTLLICADELEEAEQYAKAEYVRNRGIAIRDKKELPNWPRYNQDGTPSMEPVCPPVEVIKQSLDEFPPDQGGDDE